MNSIVCVPEIPKPNPVLGYNGTLHCRLGKLGTISLWQSRDLKQCFHIFTPTGELAVRGFGAEVARDIAEHLAAADLLIVVKRD